MSLWGPVSFRRSKESACENTNQHDYYILLTKKGTIPMEWSLSLVITAVSFAIGACSLGETVRPL